MDSLFLSSFPKLPASSVSIKLIRSLSCQQLPIALKVSIQCAMLKVFFLPFFVIFFAICLLAFDALSDLVMIHVLPETPVRLFFHVKGALIGMVCYYTWSIWLEWMIDTHFKFETFLVAVIELRMEASLWWSIKYIQFTSIKIEQQRKSSKKYFTQNPSSHTTASKSKSRKGKSAKKM